MANTHEIISALEGESLTEALQQIESHATRNGFAELENWCKQELQGYSRDIPSYRTGEVHWIDYIGRNASEQNRWLSDLGLPPSMASTQLPTEFPIVNGTVQLERESRKHGFATIKAPEFRNVLGQNDLRITHGRLPTSEIDNIFDHIRLEARRKLDKLLPERSVTAARYPSPKFDQIIKDTKLAQILEQRWLEAIAIYDAKAYLMTIVSLGAILEGVLLAQVKENPREASTIAETPKDRSGKPLPFKDWTLDDLIQVSHACRWIKKGSRDFSSILRDYRNLVHPREQLHKATELSQGTCNIAWEVVNAAIEDINAFQNANRTTT